MQKAQKGTKVSRLAATNGPSPGQVSQPSSGASFPGRRPEQRISQTKGPGHGKRTVRALVTLGELADAMIGDDRLEIVLALAHRPHFVGEIQRWLGLRRMGAVSEHLQHLQEFGIVTWELIDGKHFYQLTNSAKVFIEDGNVQFGMQVAAGHWLWLNIVEDGASGRVVQMPNSFIDPERLAALHKAVASARNGPAPEASEGPSVHGNPDAREVKSKRQRRHQNESRHGTAANPVSSRASPGNRRRGRK